MQKKLWLPVLVILVTLVTLIGCGSDDSKKESSSDTPTENSDAFAILSKKEEQGIMTIATVYGEFSYPTEFVKGVDVQASEEDGIPTLTFVIHMNDRKESLFTIRYGGNRGILFGTYQASKNEKAIGLYVSFAEPPADFSAEDQNTFEMAQDLFNDVIASMANNPGFVLL